MRYLLLLGALSTVMFLSAQTRITIIGTVHEPTDKINSAVLYQYLQRIKPGVILLELDASLMNEQGQFLTTLSTLEIEAVKKYQKNYTAVLRPYDIKNRNAYYRATNTFQKEAAFFKSLDSAYQHSVLDSFSRYVYENYIRINSILQQLHKETVEVINTELSGSLVKLRQKILYEDLLRVAQKNTALQRHAFFWEQNAAFWKTRNETMAEQVLRFASEFKNEEIVILTGYYHCYYLKALLEKQAGLNGIIIRTLADIE